MTFPVTRLRRLRQSEVIRNLVRETTLTRNDLMMPLFVCPGKGVDKPISSMPGNSQLSVDKLVEKGKELYGKGVQSVLLFGIPESKDETGEVACQHNGIVQQAVRALKKEIPGLYLVADVCNCEYTSHGHCGTIVNGDVHNDLTLETLAKQSVSLAEAGVDMVAPSDMMDGRVQAIRAALDENDFTTRPLWPIPQNMLRLFTVRSAKLPKARHSLATAKPTRWTRPTATKPCAKWSSTSKKAPTL
jgi:porphobilinogen synthase